MAKLGFLIMLGIGALIGATSCVPTGGLSFADTPAGYVSGEG